MTTAERHKELEILLNTFRYQTGISHTILTDYHSRLVDVEFQNAKLDTSRATLYFNNTRNIWRVVNGDELKDLSLLSIGGEL